MYFTTTRLHQELAGGTFHDVIIDEAHDASNHHPFKGNVDLHKLDTLVKKYGAGKIPYVCVAVTVNMAGGQPVSMKNLQELRAYTHKHGIKIILDMTRIAENAYFIQQREEGYAHKSIKYIVKEICSYTDGATMSAKKDALVNIGGFLALNDQQDYEEASNLVVVYEGLHTYGGLAGRDMEAMAIGIEESISDAHMKARIGQVIYLGEQLLHFGIPITEPIGGHGIFLDAKRFLPHVPQEKFPARLLPQPCMWIVVSDPWSVASFLLDVIQKQEKIIHPNLSSSDSLFLVVSIHKLTWMSSPNLLPTYMLTAKP
jgi:tyrosine phenol-lyase